MLVSGRVTYGNSCRIISEQIISDPSRWLVTLQNVVKSKGISPKMPVIYNSGLGIIVIAQNIMAISWESIRVPP